MFLWLLGWLLGLVLLGGCDRPQAKVNYGPGGLPARWEVAFRGVEKVSVVKEQPEALRVHALRIDLREPTLSFFVTPPANPATQEFALQTTSDFLVKHRLQAALNASPFVNWTEQPGKLVSLAQVAVAQGVASGKPVKGDACLVLTRDRKAQIVKLPADLANAYQAVGGYGIIVRDGKNVAGKDVRHPRTAVGLSRDGSKMFWLVIDGRQPGFSVGADSKETADWLIWLGADVGMQLDGGGSTTLVLARPDGAAQVLNCPIHGHFPGTERAVANHLGLFAQPVN